MIHRAILVLTHEIYFGKFYKLYQSLLKNQWRDYEFLREQQNYALERMIKYCYEEIPYYRELFDSLHLKPEDIKLVEDLPRLPVLTKDIIKKNWGKFYPKSIGKIRYLERSTGGTTGVPFRYRQDEYDRALSLALRYRGWSYAGYKLGDKLVIVGGSSILPRLNSKLARITEAYIKNAKFLSAFDMSDSNLRKYVKIINSFKPRFIYGYASALYFLSRWIVENSVSIWRPRAIFTTSEKLYDYMRSSIELAFNCEVFDNYGLNDGGVSAFECDRHEGLHVDMERSVMEIVNEEGYPIEKGEGRILATSLYNYSMPFLRYDTGDWGVVDKKMCACNRGLPLIKEIKGRTVDVFVTPEGTYVHGWYFLRLFRHIFNLYPNSLKEYQVIQKGVKEILIKVVPSFKFRSEVLNEIEKIIKAKSSEWHVEFEIVDYIERTASGKFKFIKSELKM